MVKENSYITIQSWMRNELNLTGNDLLVYAIIYGFSQDGESHFTGSLQYLADWCGATKQGIQKNIKNLIDKGLITKFEQTKNNIKLCEYSCILCNSVAHPIQLSCINNIEDTKGEVYSSKEEYSDFSEYDSHSISAEDFIGSGKKKTPVKRLTLYEKCIASINQFTKDFALQDMLTNYLDIRLKMTDKPIYGIAQWNKLLDKLYELSKESGKQIMIVKQSIEHGWASFYALPVSNAKDKFSEGDGLSCERNNTTSEERAERLRKQGKTECF